MHQRISAVLLSALDRDAQRMASDAHIGYLSELLNALRSGSSDPAIDALRLLRAMWGSAYASRDQPRAALNDVGTWLEKLLTGEPTLDAEHVAERAGWLKRLAKYHATTRRPGSAERPPRLAHPTFGRDIDALARKRTAAAGIRPTVAATARPTGATPGASAPPRPPTIRPAAPTVLPDQVEARFADLRAARDAWRTKQERARKGKPPKDRLLPVRPLDATLTELAKDLCISIERTDGLDSYFRRLADHAGAADLPFLIVLRDGPLARRIRHTDE